MTVLVVLGYAAWIGITLAVCAYIMSAAAFFTMDTQDYKVWTVATAFALAVAVLSGYGLWTLS